MNKRIVKTRWMHIHKTPTHIWRSDAWIFADLMNDHEFEPIRINMDHEDAQAVLDYLAMAEITDGNVPRD